MNKKHTAVIVSIPYAVLCFLLFFLVKSSKLFRQHLSFCPVVWRHSRDFKGQCPTIQYRTKCPQHKRAERERERTSAYVCSLCIVACCRKQSAHWWHQGQNYTQVMCKIYKRAGNAQCAHCTNLQEMLTCEQVAFKPVTFCWHEAFFVYYFLFLYCMYNTLLFCSLSSLNCCISAALKT